MVHWRQGWLPLELVGQDAVGSVLDVPGEVSVGVVDLVVVVEDFADVVLQVLKLPRSPRLVEAYDHRSGLVGVAVESESAAACHFAYFSAAFQALDCVAVVAWEAARARLAQAVACHSAVEEDLCS